MLKTSWFLTSAALIALATPAYAQDVAQAEEAATPDDGAIIVTATRRSEVLTDIPLAVSAVTAETLATQVRMICVR